MPARSSAASSKPISCKALRRSYQVLPAAMMPSQASARGHGDLVDAIRARECQRRIQPRVVDLLLLLQAVGRYEIWILPRPPALPVQLEFGFDDVDAVEADFDAAVFIGDIGDDFEADPQAAEARQGEAKQAEVEDLLRAARIEDRHQRIV